MGDEAFCPEPEAGLWDGKHCLANLSNPDAAGRGLLMGEECQDRAGAALMVAEIQMMGARIVEVDRLLDQAQPENVAVKGEIAGGVCRRWR
jgi:hypothetical protein